MEDGPNFCGLLRKSELFKTSFLDHLSIETTASRLIGSFPLRIIFFVKIKIEEFYLKKYKKAHAALSLGFPSMVTKEFVLKQIMYKF